MSYFHVFYKFKYWVSCAMIEFFLGYISDVVGGEWISRNVSRYSLYI